MKKITLLALTLIAISTLTACGNHSAVRLNNVSRTTVDGGYNMVVSYECYTMDTPGCEEEPSCTNVTVYSVSGELEDANFDPASDYFQGLNDAPTTLPSEHKVLWENQYCKDGAAKWAPMFKYRGDISSTDILRVRVSVSGDGTYIDPYRDLMLHNPTK